MRLTSIEFSFDPCNIYRDGPMGVGYQLTHVQLAIAILLVTVFFRYFFKFLVIDEADFLAHVKYRIVMLAFSILRCLSKPHQNYCSQ